MKKLVFLFILIFFISFTPAICTDNQININTASLSELDGIYGIGSTKAQNIIGARPYSSIDDLTKASGIAEKTLNKIKEEGLACVGTEKVEKKIEQNITEEVVKESSKIIEQEIKQEVPEPIANKVTSFAVVQEKEETINLNPKTIKTENSNSKDKNNTRYIILGFIFILIALSLLKPKKQKNEFTN